MIMSFPDLVAFGGDWETYVDELYRIYLSDIVNGGLHFNGLRISCQYRPPSQGKHFGFWHVISEGRDEEERTPDFRRCERIRWIRHLIEGAGSNERISWWENTRGRDTRVVIWAEEEDFAVILAKRRGYYVLKTAYCLRSHRRATFRKEREDFWNSQKG